MLLHASIFKVIVWVYLLTWQTLVPALVHVPVDDGVARVFSVDDMATHVWTPPHNGYCNNVCDLSVHQHYYAWSPKLGTALGGGFTVFFKCDWHAAHRLRQHKMRGATSIMH